MKKLVCLTIVLMVVFTACKKDNTDDFEVVGKSNPKAEVTVSLAEFNGINYHIIINDNGEEVLVDDSGNEIEQANDGKFYDPNSGNEIDITNDTLSIDPVLIDGKNQNDLAKKILNQDEQNNDPRIEEGDNTEANDYNPNSGNRIATSGTVIKQAIFTNDGLTLDSNIKINSSTITESAVTVNLTIDYSTDFNEMIDEVLTSAIAVYCKDGSFYTSDTKQDTITTSGSLTGEYSVSLPAGEEIDYAVLRISSSEIKLG